MMWPTPPPEIARAGLRALRAVAAADGIVGTLEHDLLSAVQRNILHTDFDIASLDAITPAQLAAEVAEPALRERIIGGSVLMALIDGEPSKSELALVASYAQALQVSMSVLTNLKRLTHDRLLIARFDIARRSFIGQKVKERIANEGLRGMAHVLKTMRLGDADVAARYQQLESLPEGTLGREYARFIRGNGFAFPGEDGGAPELILFHDCTHVLGGYGTTPIEEVQVAVFSAAFRKQDPFAMVLFAMAQFHLGLQVTPAAAPEKMVVEPELMMGAIARGAQVNTDLSDNWDPWHGDFEVTVDELRRRYNILPRSADTAG